MIAFNFNFIEVSLLFFFIGFWGLLSTRRNLVLVLIAVELMLFGVSLSFLMTSAGIDDIAGQVFALLILTVAASESAIGLAIVVVNYRLKGVINLESFMLLNNVEKRAAVRLIKINKVLN